MGLLYSMSKNYEQDKDNIKLLMIGLDASGKSSILNTIKNCKIKRINQSFDLQICEFKNINIISLDYNLSQYNIMLSLINQYCDIIDGFIFVVDSNDIDRLEEAIDAFKKLINEEFKCPILIMANKQDLTEALSPKEINKKFEMAHIQNRIFIVKGTSIFNEDSIQNSIDWIISNFEKNKKF